jgi:hypothetical protein
MNAKINTDINSLKFINKITFWLMIICILVAIIIQFVALKSNFLIINVPYIIANYLAEFNFNAQGNIFDYLNYSLPFIFSVIFLYFLTPFCFIFSLSPALKALKEKRYKISFELINFLLSTLILISLLISLLYFNYFNNHGNLQQLNKLNSKLQESKEINKINNLALEIRNLMSTPKINKGWYGMTQKEFDLYKQYQANFITDYINKKDINSVQITKAVPTLVEFYKLNLKLFIKDGPIYNLNITPHSHSIVKEE